MTAPEIARVLSHVCPDDNPALALRLEQALLRALGPQSDVAAGIKIQQDRPALLKLIEQQSRGFSRSSCRSG